MNYLRKIFVLRKVFVVDICLELIYKFDKSLLEFEILKRVFEKYVGR